ncbi:MAG: 5-(carboxyamino)imidazole ribonucleotide mutase [Gammaproteobacteria bacterium]
MYNPFVAILMGSDSDLPTMQNAADVLKSLGVTCEVRITSAHRTPAATAEYVKTAEARGCAVFIAGAGLAAHLAGAVAANTLRPVIGVPLASGSLGGLDALLATVQMPPGVPVASVAINGAKNAGYLAAQIMALTDGELAKRLQTDREAKAQDVQAKNAAMSRS